MKSIKKLTDLVLGAAVNASPEARRIRNAYRAVFRGPMGEVVLADLADACCMTSSGIAEDDSGRADQVRSNANLGKQDVYRHIMNMMRMDDETIDTMFNREIQE